MIKLKHIIIAQPKHILIAPNVIGEPVPEVCKRLNRNQNSYWFQNPVEPKADFSKTIESESGPETLVSIATSDVSISIRFVYILIRVLIYYLMPPEKYKTMFVF